MFTRLLSCSFATAPSLKKYFIKLTPAAVDRLKSLMAAKNNDKIIGVKVSLTKKGCNGLTYNMNYVEKPYRFDYMVEHEGISVIIDSKALMALVGTELDYVVTETSEYFVFKNPNYKGKCGCGYSFHI